MLIELLILACLKAAPDECRDFSLRYEGQMTPLSCVMASHTELVRWQRAHPAWKIARWSCSLRDKSEAEI